MREGHASRTKAIVHEMKELFKELCDTIEEEDFGQRDFEDGMGGYGERGGGYGERGDYGQRDGGYGERRRR